MYILHDHGQKTRDRVDWVMTQHLGDTSPDDAWKPMRDTWEDRTKLKILSGVPTTGRDNTAPVLHYTLAWHKDDKPTQEHMQAMALETLKVMGLGEHQAVIAAHADKVHLHVHVVVNTVHPETGKTAALKYTKEKLSQWAQAYEREHGVHCEERIKNNAERERHAKARKLDPTDLLIGRKADATKQLMGASKIEVKARKPYVPVKHKATSRKQWFEKKDVTDRMKAMRLAIDAEIKSARDATWARHSKERDALDTRSEAAVDQARERIRSVYQPKWRNLYYNQKKEAKYVGRVSGDLLERAVYVFQNRERLGVAGKLLTLRQMLPLIRSGQKLQSRVADIHEQERRALARESKFESKALTDAIWQRHKSDMGWLRDKHSAERQSERDAQAMQRKSVSFELAKAALSAERAQAPRQFTKAPDPVPVRQPMPPPERSKQPSAPSKMAAPPPLEQQFKQAVDATAPQAALSRSEQIKRDMADWRRRNEGNDFGREL